LEDGGTASDERFWAKQKGAAPAPVEGVGAAAQRPRHPETSIASDGGGRWEASG
jgi:hypothetical protein